MIHVALALREFEEKVAALFNAGQIRAPVHLHYGNEMRLIALFEGVRRQDWVLCSWRSHYHCLLKGVPEAELLAEITAGRSLALCFPQHRILSTAIVGGQLPIAVGLAMAIRRSQADERVYCFMGDMTAETGIAHECITYSHRHGLPVTFVVEDNGVSVCTDTMEAWGGKTSSWPPNVIRYHYQSQYPHAGAGKRVQF